MDDAVHKTAADQALPRLVRGFTEFRRDYFERDRVLYEGLSHKGQSPEVMIVACSDARVDPAIVTRTEPGDLFVIRNVAAIVPPREADRHYHGTSAALEFGVKGLGVGHIVVLGHALCGGLRHLRDRAQGAKAATETGQPQEGSGFEFLSDWVQIARPAFEAVEPLLETLPPEEARRTLEQAAVLVSLSNLLSFPWVRDPVAAGTLRLHGWYFDLTTGELSAFDHASASFRPVRELPDALPADIAAVAARMIAECGSCAPTLGLTRFVQEKAKFWCETVKG